MRKACRGNANPYWYFLQCPSGIVLVDMKIDLKGRRIVQRLSYVDLMNRCPRPRKKSR